MRNRNTVLGKHGRFSMQTSDFRFSFKGLTLVARSATLGLAFLMASSCGVVPNEHWEPLDRFQKGDVNAKPADFGLYPDTVISYRYSYSPSYTDVNGVVLRGRSLEEFEQAHSDSGARILQNKADRLGAPDGIRFVSTPVANNGRNIIMTINYKVEGEPAAYRGIITIRQGHRYFQRSVEYDAQYRNSLPTSEEGRVLDSLSAQLGRVKTNALMDIFNQDEGG